MEAHGDMIVPIDHQSIFSETTLGVASPTIFHEHPYPTRFHGPIYSYPRFYKPYKPSPWNTSSPGATGPGGMIVPTASLRGVDPNERRRYVPAVQRSVPAVQRFVPSGIMPAQVPSGIMPAAMHGDVFGSPTGNKVFDVLIGAGIGYMAAPNSKDRTMWAGAGGLAALLLGTLGMVGTVGAAVYSRR